MKGIRSKERVHPPTHTHTQSERETKGGRIRLVRDTVKRKIRTRKNRGVSGIERERERERQRDVSIGVPEWIGERERCGSVSKGKDGEHGGVGGAPRERAKRKARTSISRFDRRHRFYERKPFSRRFGKESGGDGNGCGVLLGTRSKNGIRRVARR